MLFTGARVVITNPEQGFYIFTSTGTACEHPRDYIFMPWGYSPWIGAANSLKQTSLLFFASILSFVLCFTNLHL